MLPCICVTRRRQIDSPRPGAAEAPGDRAVGLRKGLEQGLVLVGRDADATVAHREVQHARGRRRRTARPHRDRQMRHAFGELQGIAHQVVQHLPQAQRVAEHPARHAGRDVDASSARPFWRDAGRKQVHHPLQHLVDVQRHLFQPQLAGLDLGIVEHVVQQAHQRHRRGVGLVDETARRLRQPVVQRQPGQADDAVHGRADLVAHVGQEAALAARGAPRPRCGPAPARRTRGAARCCPVRQQQLPMALVFDARPGAGGLQPRAEDRLQVHVQVAGIPSASVASAGIFSGSRSSALTRSSTRPGQFVFGRAGQLVQHAVALQAAQLVVEHAQAHR
jgi:hypothetical protein